MFPFARTLDWFDFRYEIFGDFPMAEHYDEAGYLLESLMELPVADNDEVMADLYKVVKGFGPLHPSQRPTKKTSFQSRVLNALPDDFRDAVRAWKQHEGDLTELHQPDATRSIEFLEEHGKCLDNIRPGRSTVEGAGLGAFATRDIPTGAVITASPLHHVPDRKFANIYKFKKGPNEEQWERTDEVIGYQLMLNYCYAHSNSTALFSPYGAGINYINHNREKANAKIRWAENFPLGHDQTAVESGPFELLNQTERPFLAFDYVATEDIKAGQEIFLDYGDEWIAGARAKFLMHFRFRCILRPVLS